MDKYSEGGERGFMAPKKGCKFAFKDTAPERGQDGQFCNRIGCSGRIKYGQNMKSGSSDKAKQSPSVFRCSNVNETTQNSSKDNPTMTKGKRSSLDSKSKLSSQSRCESSESSISSDSGGTSSPPSRTPTSYQSESLKKSRKFTMMEDRGSNSSVNVRVNKVSQNKSVSRNQNTQNVKPFRKSSESELFNNNGSRHALRNLKCNTTSDVVPPNSPSSNSKSVRKSVMEKTESSLSRKWGKGPLTLDQHVSPSTSSISISDARQNDSNSGKNSTAAASVRSRRSTVGNSRKRPPCLQNGRDHSAATGSSQISHNEIPINIGDRGSSRQFLANLSPSSSSSYSLSSSNNGDYSFGSLPFTPAELGFTNLMNRNTLHQYNMDGIAEVLLALERIGQNEGLTHEQLQALETSLFLSGFNIYDQHRDMRLDIDNMSYEELLALEERMGTVSMALPEEALSSCLKRDTYQVTPSELRLTGSGEDGSDTKCSICQEEYVSGDEMGRLVECEHGFHDTCINQWLQLKNWCPICKAEAAPTQ